MKLKSLLMIIFVTVLISVLIACGDATVDGTTDAQTDGMTAFSTTTTSFCAIPTTSREETTTAPTVVTAVPVASPTYEPGIYKAPYRENEEIINTALNREKMTNGFLSHPNRPIHMLEGYDDIESYLDMYSSKGYSSDVNDIKEQLYDKYSGEFFDENVLFIVYIVSGSGSYRFRIYSVENDGECFTVGVAMVDYPEVGTADMAGWFAVVEAKRTDIASCTSFDAIYYSHEEVESPSTSQ